MEKCPKCERGFLSKNRFQKISQKGQDLLVCPICFQENEREKIRLAEEQERRRQKEQEQEKRTQKERDEQQRRIHKEKEEIERRIREEKEKQKTETEERLQELGKLSDPQSELLLMLYDTNKKQEASLKRLEEQNVFEKHEYSPLGILLTAAENTARSGA